MPDSDPTHDNPKDIRNLPAVVQEGELVRPAADNWLTRAIRTLFGWKPGSVRDDLQVVLVTIEPAAVATEGTTEVLPPARNLRVSIVVGNAGNSIEKHVTVTATVAPAT